MPVADSTKEEICAFRENALSGTDHRDRRRIEVAPGVQDRLGTKAAHTENEDDVLEGFHDGTAIDLVQNFPLAPPSS